MNKIVKTAIIAVCLLAMVLVGPMILEEEAVCQFVSKDVTLSLTREIWIQQENGTEFPAVVRSSGKKPVETTYTGTELRELIEILGLTWEGVEQLRFVASDGYQIVIGIEEILEPKNVYLTYMRDQKLLKPKNRQGAGPFQLIIRSDPFSQRWIKHVIEIHLE